MANPALFSRLPCTTTNRAGGAAYALHPKHALAQYAATGCLNATFYAGAVEQLRQVVNLAYEVAPDFVARTALFCRRRSFMKDVPAVLCAVLSLQDGELLERVFHRVVDDGKMLRTFVQVMRSGAVGRQSLGARPKRLVRQWLERRPDDAVFRAAVGQSPSLADVVKMVHPKPTSPARAALYGYLLGKPTAGLECALVREFERFKADPSGAVPDVPFLMLTGLDLEERHWKAIAAHASWQTTRMNLNTFARHGVFREKKMVSMIANRLRDAHAIRQARAFPYQLMAAALNVDLSVPREVKEALHDAMEVALENVPELAGRVVVLPDVSGSMLSPVTGQREGATTAVRCIDVAALVAAAVLRKNPRAEVLPFAETVRPLRLNPRARVVDNAAKLAALGGGGTHCSAPLARLNAEQARPDVVVYVSDNESWMDDRGVGRSSATLAEWERLKARHPTAKLVCLDIQPGSTTQALERRDILNVGGFSDQVFEAVSEFTRHDGTCAWVDTIEQEEL